jgi:hypothetical protein
MAKNLLPSVVSCTQSVHLLLLLSRQPLVRRSSSIIILLTVYSFFSVLNISVLGAAATSRAPSLDANRHGVLRDLALAVASAGGLVEVGLMAPHAGVLSNCLALNFCDLGLVPRVRTVSSMWLANPFKPVVLVSLRDRLQRLVLHAVHFRHPVLCPYVLD